ncbi:MAG TPA: hypothetical protein VFY28_02605 [Candidatus Paceibacterota bacterium]|nr:hypothetical protein [Candidatus Paceibacterota bacterium]
MRSDHAGHINICKTIGDDGDGDDEPKKPKSQSLIPRLSEQYSFLENHLELQRGDQFPNAH